ncbi:GH92 family glycosyl hydrolase [Amycolatopsis alkalitolerans]|uniref:Glycoside hydrolase family 92 protein n=1 Tax=Amycolatopsis alkalitolerans TaxID=2547244 RepID=A0A5C4LQP3_9PSEU|nr:GH92 family glycosyl hydrolase [Amycolatopsis alkalitolerans]TNC19620.1 glycoside hydrolase family 92 protein [Amycolatopsis alkalitolerans]
MSTDRFFSSFEAGEPAPLHGDVGGGPARSPTAKAGVGFTGTRALRYDRPGHVRLFDVDVPAGEHTELSYVVFPENGLSVALDAELDDGSRLPGTLDPKALYPDQWNLVRRPVPAGRTVRAIVLDAPDATGWLDDVRIADRPPRRQDPVDWVRTTRGTHSSPEFSRGNTFPATAVPHGFNFWTPVTDASSTRWLYEYHRRNGAANRPRLAGFALSHQPSPWMGDRHTFHVAPEGDLAFGHEHETDRPYHYGVRFDDGTTADLAPADHAALFRFTFPGTGAVRFSCGRGGVRLDPKRGVVTGYTSVRSRLSAGARRMFVYGTFDRPARRRGKTLAFDAATVDLRIATSLISLKQARRNLDAEIPAGTSFEQVRDRARQEWQDLLARVELDGATEDQLTTFYSGLYRMFLYPNSGHEETPSGRRHASPVVRRWWPSTRRRTGAKVVDGPMSVNNGFWDTYRTTWPAYALLTPGRCGELIEGFVQQYREGGWIARWSSPGYADLMTGTSSDVAFADAYLKGVRGFDVHAAYEAALKNATVAPPNRAVGRKGLRESIFLGYTPLTTHEGLSWALEGYINDFGLANLAEALGTPDEAKYFRQRALHYVHHFDERTGFFQGRHRDGRWRWAPHEYDPTLWGHDYTETDGWNMAFSVPHDGNGLANLLGGRAALESKLDTFFATPETGRNPGSYRGIIHEMTEARDVRLGQYGHSNQPSHHIPWMYAHAGAAAKGQGKVREVLTRCYLGSEIGQGYPGDEDNGEMSAWYVFAALGLYPLAVGSPAYVLGAPLFRRAVVHLESGNRLVITASSGGPYIQSLRVDGEPHEESWIAHDVLAAGATLEFTLGEQPSGWGTPPPSLTEGGDPPRPLTDLTRRDHTALFDDTSRTQITFDTATPVIEYKVDGPPRPVEIYTLTSGTRGAPSAWVLEGSADGHRWTELDRRAGETFPWARQTRPFALAEPAAWPRYRLRVTASAGRRMSLAQWELLAGER